MTEKIERLVDGLAGREFVGDVCRLLDEHLGRGDTGYLADVAAALNARYGSGREGAEHRYLFDRILWDLVTTPGRENVAHAVRLGLSDGPRTGRSVRRAAAVLAAHQSTADLAVLYAPGRAHDDAPDELRACLVQESALRGAPIAELPEAVAWAESSPSWAGHPLALLPWSLMPLEGEPRLPRYSRGGAAYGVRYGLPDGRPLPVGSAVPAPAPGVHRGPDEPALTAAVERWAGRSDGRVESAVFLLDEPLTGRPAVHPLLAALPLDCLVDVPAAPDRLTVVPGSAAEAWSRLFGAASLGGGHSDGWWYGAYGRLAAWRSLTALVGAPEGTPVPEVAERARGCDWYAFEASNDWFNQDGMDFALLTVARDRRRLAVLAATDYDGG